MLICPYLHASTCEDGSVGGPGGRWDQHILRGKTKHMYGCCSDYHIGATLN
jgi:hypothetical protein